MVILDLTETLPAPRSGAEPDRSAFAPAAPGAPVAPVAPAAPTTEPLGVASLRVRPLDPDSDGPRLLAMGDHVSQQTIYQRFFTSFHRMPAPLLTLLLDVDHDRREALVALDGEQIVAVARYAVLRKRPDEADVSILVVDAWQRRGIASRLLRLLDERAAAHGVRTFTADVLLENRQARGLLAAVRPDATARYVDGSSAYRFPVGSAPAAGVEMHGGEAAAA